MRSDVYFAVASESASDRRADTAARLGELFREKLIAAMNDLSVGVPEIVDLARMPPMVSAGEVNNWHKAALFDAGLAKDTSASRLFRITIEEV